MAMFALVVMFAAVHLSEQNADLLLGKLRAGRASAGCKAWMDKRVTTSTVVAGNLLSDRWLLSPLWNTDGHRLPEWMNGAGFCCTYWCTAPDFTAKMARVTARSVGMSRNSIQCACVAQNRVGTTTTRVRHTLAQCVSDYESKCVNGSPPTNTNQLRSVTRRQSDYVTKASPVVRVPFHTHKPHIVYVGIPQPRKIQTPRKPLSSTTTARTTTIKNHSHCSERIYPQVNNNGAGHAFPRSYVLSGVCAPRNDKSKYYYTNTCPRGFKESAAHCSSSEVCCFHHLVDDEDECSAFLYPGKVLLEDSIKKVRADSLADCIGRCIAFNKQRNNVKCASGNFYPKQAKWTNWTNCDLKSKTHVSRRNHFIDDVHVTTTYFAVDGGENNFKCDSLKIVDVPH